MRKFINAKLNGGGILRLFLATNHSQIDSLIEKLESEKGIKELETFLKEDSLSSWAKPLLIVDQVMYRERVIERAKAARPDIILLYDKLPGMVDLELILEELRLEVKNNQDRDVRIVFLTSQEQGSTLLRKAVEIGIWDIVAGRDIRPIEIIKRIYKPANYSDAAHFKLAPEDGTKYKFIPRYVEKEKVIEVPVVQEKEVVKIVREKEFVRVGNTNSKETVLLWSPSETGKTFLSVNLATALAKRGFRVALIDADLENRTLENFFNVDPDKRYVFVKALTQKRYSGEVLKDCYTYKKNLKVLTLPSGKAEIPEISAGEFFDLFAAIRGDFDIFIIDGAKDIRSNLTKAALSLASRVFLVVTPDLIRAKFLKTKLLELSGQGIRLDRFQPVVNFALPGNCPGKKELKEMLELEPVGEIPPAFQEAYASICEGIPAIDGKHDNTSFSEAINALADQVYAGKDCYKNSGGKSLFMKLFKRKE